MALSFAVLATVFIAQRQSMTLAELPNQLVYATSAVSAAGGTLAAGIIAYIFDEITFENTADFGDLLVAAIGVAIAAAIVAAAMVAAERNIR